MYVVAWTDPLSEDDRWDTFDSLDAVQKIRERFTDVGMDPDNEMLVFLRDDAISTTDLLGV